MLEKTSKARLYTFRLNPVNPHEAIAMQQLDDAIVSGIAFKQTIVDALVARAGVKPELFDQPGTGNSVALTFEQVQGYLQEFAEQLRREFTSGRITPALDEQHETKGKVSKFAKNFLKNIEESQVKYEDAVDEA